MADDNGLYADIEAGFVTAIKAIKLVSGGDNDTVFNASGVDHQKWQIKSLRDFRTYYPFAYVRCAGTPAVGREGGDLLQRITVEIEYGTYIASGNARIGTGTDAGEKQLGLSRLRDLLITALDRVLITTTKANTEAPVYKGDKILVDCSESGKNPNYCCSGLMTFEIDQIGV